MKCACSKMSSGSWVAVWAGVWVAVFVPMFARHHGAKAGADTTVVEFRPAAREVVLKVEGMACEGCAKDVTEALTDVPGVEAARVELKEGRAYVTLAAEGAPGVEKLVEAATNPSRTVTVVAKGEAVGK